MREVKIDGKLLYVFAQLYGGHNYKEEELFCRILDGETADGENQVDYAIQYYANPSDPVWRMQMDRYGDGPHLVIFYEDFWFESEEDFIIKANAYTLDKITYQLKWFKNQYERVSSMMNNIGLSEKT